MYFVICSVRGMLEGNTSFSVTVDGAGLAPKSDVHMVAPALLLRGTNTRNCSVATNLKESDNTRKEREREDACTTTSIE